MSKKSISFRQIMDEALAKKLQEEDLHSNDKIVDDDYQLALELQRQFDEEYCSERNENENENNDSNNNDYDNGRMKEEEKNSNDSNNSNMNQSTEDEDLALAIQLQLAEQEEYEEYKRTHKQQTSSKLIIKGKYDEYEPYYDGLEETTEGDERRELYLGVNSSLGDEFSDDFVVRSQPKNKHSKEIAGRVNASRVMNSIEGSGNLSPYSIDDKAIVKMKKYFSHKTGEKIKKSPQEKMETTNTQLDNRTRIQLVGYINKGSLDGVGGVIDNGKEAIVLSGLRNGIEPVCIKIFKSETMEFKNKMAYMVGEHRYRYASRTKTHLNPKFIPIWAKKEFMNLKDVYKHGIPCPFPISCEKNVLLMSMIGEDEIPASKLKDVLETSTKHAKTYFAICLRIMQDLIRKVHLVHADFSGYNLLVWKGGIYVIDMGQSVDIYHPNAVHFLKRDIRNLVTLFNRIFHFKDEKEIMKKVLEYVMEKEQYKVLTSEHERVDDWSETYFKDYDEEENNDIEGDEEENNDKEENEEENNEEGDEEETRKEEKWKPLEPISFDNYFKEIKENEHSILEQILD